MRGIFVSLALLAASPAVAQGWGNVAKQEAEKGFSWFDPLWPSFWMAWTPATFALFCGIFGAIAVIGPLADAPYEQMGRLISSSPGWG